MANNNEYCYRCDLWEPQKKNIPAENPMGDIASTQKSYIAIRMNSVGKRSCSVGGSCIGNTGCSSKKGEFVAISY